MYFFEIKKGQCIAFRKLCKKCKSRLADALCACLRAVYIQDCDHHGSFRRVRGSQCAVQQCALHAFAFIRKSIFLSVRLSFLWEYRWLRWLSISSKACRISRTFMWFMWCTWSTRPCHISSRINQRLSGQIRAIISWPSMKRYLISVRSWSARCCSF